MKYKGLFSEFEISDNPEFWTVKYQPKNAPKSKAERRYTDLQKDQYILNELQEGNKAFSKLAGTRKIADLPKVCRHLEHLPPMYQAWEPRIYEHICPSCGHRTQFTINPPVYTGQTVY